MKSTFVSALALIVLLSSSAHAQDDTRRARGAVVYEEGQRLHGASREADALVKFQEAYDIYPSPNALFAVARSEQLLGRPVDSIKHFKQAIANPLLNSAFVEQGKSRIRELEQKVAHLDVIAPDGAKIMVDGEAASSPMDVAPGHHVVVATLKDRRAEHQVDVGLGQASTVDVRQELDGAAEAAPLNASNRAPVVPPPAEREKKHGAGEYIAVGGLAAIGIAGIVGGVAFGSASTSNHNEAQSSASARGPCFVMASSACSDLNSLNDAAGRDRTLGIVSYAVGGAFLAGAAITGIYFFGRSSEHKQAFWIAPGGGPGTASIAAGAHF